MITVFTPYGMNQKLAEAYNHCMHISDTEWTLLLDHDVFLACNPLWYRLCLDATENCSSDTGLITCVTYNRNGFDLKVKNSSDLYHHINYAGMIYHQNKNALVESEDYKRPGFFMLIRKSAWIDVGGFKDQGKGVNKVDHDFCRRLKERNYKIMIMSGLYVYHMTGVRKNKL